MDIFQGWENYMQLLEQNWRDVVQPEDTIVLDLTGKKNGRGAYLCKSGECLKKARKNKGIERSFKMSIPDAVYEELEKEFSETNAE